MRSVKNRFRKNNNYYKSLLKVSEYYLIEEQFEKCIVILSLAAEFCASNYCGFYSDIKIEKILNSIGINLLPRPSEENKNRQSGERRILHYATTLYSLGGHTRLLNNWIKNDGNTRHDLFISRQNEVVPPFISKTVDLGGGKIYQHNDRESYSNRIKSLNDIASEYDLVVLHHHPEDVIPVVTFCYNSNVPVVILNHSDHKFWVGSSICDNLIEFRDNIVKYDRERRLIDNFSVLPIPIELPSSGGYEEARMTLQVAGDEVIMLSIGTEYKYVPIDDKNFFEDIILVLDSCIRAKLFIVGISDKSDIAIKYAHPRIVYVSPTHNIDVYKRACDIYIEGYPFSSFTAYLEVGIMNKPIHFMYNVPLLNAYELKNYNYKFDYNKSSIDWKTKLEELINNPAARKIKGNRLFENIINNHVPPKWNDYLSKFYRLVDGQMHTINIHNRNVYTLTDNEFFLDKLLGVNPIKNTWHLMYDLPFVKKLTYIYSEFTNDCDYTNKSVRDVLWFLFKAK